MKNYFIRHKVKEGDITNLSDEDSEIIINNNLHNIEDPIEISTLDSIFLSVITNITKSSIEVEIIKKLENITQEKDDFHITIIQSISNEKRFNFFLEKSVEVGVHKIIPIISKYSTQSKNKCIKKHGVWQKIIRDAKEQSRNMYNIDIEKPIRIKELEDIKCGYKICLSTETTTEKSLGEVLEKKDKKKSYVIAIGPEKGWSSSDLKVFESLGFEFTKIGSNILRTETGALVISSILNFRNGKY